MVTYTGDPLLFLLFCQGLLLLLQYTHPSEGHKFPRAQYICPVALRPGKILPLLALLGMNAITRSFFFAGCVCVFFLRLWLVSFLYSLDNGQCVISLWDAPSVPRVCTSRVRARVRADIGQLDLCRSITLHNCISVMQVIGENLLL